MSANSKNERSREAKAAARAKSAELLRRQRAQERRRRMLVWGSGILAVVVVGGIIASVIAANAGAKPTAQASGAAPTASTAPATASGAQSVPPWNAPSDPSARAKAAGLTMLSSEGTAEHIHSHLTVTVRGKAVRVPALIGIDEQAASISPLHTHDESGIVHVESPVKQPFTLGQVFTEWDVALAPGRIGSYSAGSGDTVTTFVNGKPVTGDPAAIALADHEDIDIVVTTGGAKASPPAPFSWPAGY